jgi:hypothetical protein
VQIFGPTLGEIDPLLLVSLFSAVRQWACKNTYSARSFHPIAAGCQINPGGFAPQCEMEEIAFEQKFAIY